jgi:hypothetical protein
MWTSLATGKRPEKHGVTHFLDTASNVACRRLWDILEQPDRPIGVFGWPVTWPPRPARGFVIPSLFARDSTTFPEELGFMKDPEEGLNRRWVERLRLIGTAMRYALRPVTVARMAQYVVVRRLGQYSDLDRFARNRLVKLDIQQASVLDVAPTTLAPLGMPISRDMDGRVLTEATSPEFLVQTPLAYIDSHDSDLERNHVGDGEPTSEETMVRLRDLGYVE